MTAADKLRELLSTRPAMPNTEELVRWWRSSSDLLTVLLADLEAIDCDLAAERCQHRSNVESFESALAQEAYEKGILEQVNAELRAEVERVRGHNALAQELEVKRVLMLDANLAELRRLDVALANARAQAEANGHELIRAGVEVGRMQPVLTEALERWYGHVAEIANTPSGRIDSGNCEYVEWAKRECKRIAELQRQFAAPPDAIRVGSGG